MELYYRIKLAGELLVVSIIIFSLLALLVASIVSSNKKRRIEKYLFSIGYKRELISTAAFGTNHTYGYTRRKDGNYEVIRDYELRRMSLKQVKEKYK